VPAVVFDILPDRELWGGQLGETAKQYRAFLVYRERLSVRLLSDDRANDTACHTSL
jgi:hypothetical protein